jgi:tetratricopeptide (TPR) repeat protein
MSAYFDPKDKNNKHILDYFLSKSWLVIESSSSARVSIKKTLTQIGAQMGNMIDADNITDAEKIISERKPHFVITNKLVNGVSALGLYDLHMKTIPNRIKAGFFVITEENSLSEVAWALEYEMEGIISLPLNGTTVIRTVLDGVKNKINPTPYTTQLEEGRTNYINQELEKAMEQFQAAIKLDEHPYEGHSCIGLIYTDKKQVPEAIAAFEESIKHNSQYFKALNRLSSLYYQEKNFKKSYETNLLMVQKFPVSPEKIPDLIRLSIINKKYEDIANYFKLFQNIESPSIEMQNYLAAALAILGKYFVTTNDSEKAIVALKDAFKYSNGKYEVIKSITLSFQELNEGVVLFDLYDKIDLGLWPKEIQALYFYATHLASTDDSRVVQAGEKLLKSDLRDPLIYKGIIERSIKMKRKMSYIEEMIAEGSKYFPESSKELEALVKS